ncbi:PRC-barrel domain-containing protein [Candidatus Woesearchaeota archaeon]|nr:PRC-barrel domain-containing protein [Candidatus Woesearchaeota archaeon]
MDMQDKGDKRLTVISPAGISRHFNLLNIIGKKVITKNGKVFGRVKDIAFDTGKVIGIIISSFFGMKRTIISCGYIEQLNSDSVVLKINPVTSLKGKIVFDKDGKRLGRVSEIKRVGTSNDFSEVTVRRLVFFRPVRILKKDMDVIGKNIILNKIIK